MTDLRFLYGRLLRLQLADLAFLLGGTVNTVGDATVFCCPRVTCRSAQPTASSVDGLVWTCLACRSTGTAFELVDLVLRSPDAICRAREVTA